MPVCSSLDQLIKKLEDGIKDNIYTNKTVKIGSKYNERFLRNKKVNLVNLSISCFEKMRKNVF